MTDTYDLVALGAGPAGHCSGTLNTIADMSPNTPTHSYAYKYAAFDGLRRLATAEGRAGKR